LIIMKVVIIHYETQFYELTRLMGRMKYRSVYE
jgi:hypothetical protein